MHQHRLRNIWLLVTAVVFIALPLLSLDAGISGDEEVHLKHSEMVLDYYKTGGKDRSALQTPVTNLKYYGQGFDNVTTLLAQLFGVEDIYRFRHFCNGLIAALCILFVALLANHFAGYKAAIAATVLMCISPRFIGHAYNNLKDIPFALGYIASIYYLIKVLTLPVLFKKKYSIALIGAMAFILSIRPGGLLVFCYLVLFSTIVLWTNRKSVKGNLVNHFVSIAVILSAAYLMALLFWPYALENPILNPLKSMIIMTDYPVTLRQLFEGTLHWSDQLPWYYLLKYMGLTIPLVVFILIILFLIQVATRKLEKHKQLGLFVVLFALVFPLAYTILSGANVYGGWRHLLFIYPVLAVLAAIGFTWIYQQIKGLTLKIVFVLGLMALSSNPVLYLLKNHTLAYTYFNSLAGSYQTLAKKYELDYYYHSGRAASLWLKAYIEENESAQVVVASSYGTNPYFRNSTVSTRFFYTPYYLRGNKLWDYGIFFRTTVTPSQPEQHLWPPKGTIKSIKVNGVAVCAIVKREDVNDYLGKVAYDDGAYKNAAALLRKSVQNDPGNEIAWINLGKTYIALGHLAKAQNAFNQCLNIFPDYEPCMFYLAQIKRLQQDDGGAEENYKRIIKHNNKSFKTYVTYAELMVEKQQDIEALFILERCLKLNPRYKPALELKNKIKLHLNNK